MINNLIDILKAEVKPAMGCTEPVAVTLAAAKARVLGGHESISKAFVRVSPNIFKNGMSVGIPKIDAVGIGPAAGVGLLAGDPDMGLKIFETVCEGSLVNLEDLMDRGIIEVAIADTCEKVYIEVEISSPKGMSRAVLSGMHNHFSQLEVNGALLLDDPFVQADASYDIATYSLDEIIDTVIHAEEGVFDFLLEGLEMNRRISEMGRNEKLGLGIGYNTKKAVEDGKLGCDLATRAMYYTAAASDARMSGIALPVMSSNGSGNNGLTAILPLLAYKDIYHTPDGKMAKALALSHLINCYIKRGIGRLSALCSCGISAATGASAAIAWLEGGDREVMEGTIQNMIANLSGMICDGAKNSCAIKLATAASTGVHAAVWSKYGSMSGHLEGIVGKTATDSITNLGTLSQEGMQLTDHTILNIMRSM